MLKIGDVPFEGLAAPEDWLFGGEQKISKKQLPGGTTILQPRGYFFQTDHAWDGIFVGDDAYLFARQMDAYAEKGESVPITFFTFSVKYFVEKFTWRWTRKDWISFSISVVRDNTIVAQTTKDSDPIAKHVQSNGSATVNSATKAKSKTHKVMPGENLHRIASNYGVSVDSLYGTNKSKIGKNPSLIYAGTELVIPS